MLRVFCSMRRVRVPPFWKTTFRNRMFWVASWTANWVPRPIERFIVLGSPPPHVVLDARRVQMGGGQPQVHAADRLLGVLEHVEEAGPEVGQEDLMGGAALDRMAATRIRG